MENIITSVNNTKIKELARLKQRKYLAASDFFLIEGKHLIEEAEQAGCLTEVFTLRKDTAYSRQTVVSENVMKKLSSLNTVPGEIGLARKLKPGTLQGRVLVLDGVQDPGNMGTILRSACAFGIDTVVLSKSCVSIYNQKVIRASEGMIFHLNILEADLLPLLQRMQSEGYHIFTTDVQQGTPLAEASFGESSAVIMGSEASGVSDAVRQLNFPALNIEMHPACESLNVAVAASIILHRWYLQSL